MKTVTVDPHCRIRLGGEAPQTKFWVIPDETGYQLRRIPNFEEEKKPTVEEAAALIKKHAWNINATWEEIQKDTREID
jgi:hypothetical protein